MGGEECGEKNFQLYQDPEFYNCWTFIGDGKKVDPHGEGEEEEEEGHEEEADQGHSNETIKEEHAHGNLIGPKSGLSLILYAEHVHRSVDHYSFDHILINSEGIRVLIHEPRTFPTPVQEGFNAPTRGSVSVVLTKATRNRLGKPYSSCIPNYQIVPNVSYSVHACFGRCLMDAVATGCNCLTTEGTYITRDEDDLIHCLSVKDSNISSTVYRKLCENEVMEKFIYEKDCKQCDWPCDESSYSPRLSNTKWPLEHTNMDLLNNIIMMKPKGAAYDNLKSYLAVEDNGIEEVFDILVEKLEGHDEDTEEDENTVNNTQHAAEEQVFQETQTKCFEWTKKNLLYFNVYFKDDTVEHRVQQPSYDDSAFWSDVGGAMGLWAGLSVITVTETLSFIVSCLLSDKEKSTNQVKTLNEK